MKHRSILAICFSLLLFIFSGWAQAQKADFRNTTWGMSKEQLIEAEDANPMSELNGRLAFKVYDFFDNDDLIIYYLLDPADEKVAGVNFSVRTKVNGDFAKKIKVNWPRYISKHLGMEGKVDQIFDKETYAMIWVNERSNARFTYYETEHNIQFSVQYFSSEAMKASDVYTLTKEGQELSITKLNASFDRIKALVGKSPMVPGINYKNSFGKLFYGDIPLWGYSTNVQYDFTRDQLKAWEYSFSPSSPEVIGTWKAELSKLFGPPDTQNGFGTVYNYGKLSYMLVHKQVTTLESGSSGSSVLLKVTENTKYNPERERVPDYVPNTQNAFEGFGYDAEGNFNKRPIRNEKEARYFAKIEKFRELTGIQERDVEDVYRKLFGVTFKYEQVDQAIETVWNARQNGVAPEDVDGAVSGFTDWKNTLFDVILATAGAESQVEYYFNYDLWGSCYPCDKQRKEFYQLHEEATILSVAEIIGQAPKAINYRKGKYFPNRLSDPLALGIPENYSGLRSALRYLLQTGKYKDLEGDQAREKREKMEAAAEAKRLKINETVTFNINGRVLKGTIMKIQNNSALLDMGDRKNWWLLDRIEKGLIEVQPPASSRYTFKVGQSVKINVRGKMRKAKIVDFKDGRYKLRWGGKYATWKNKEDLVKLIEN